MQLFASAGCGRAWATSFVDEELPLDAKGLLVFGKDGARHLHLGAQRGQCEAPAEEDS